LAQAPSANLNLLVRTKDDPAKLAPALRERIWSIDKDQPITNVQTMESVLARSVAEPRFRTILVGTFAVLGVILASIGIYGVVSYSVSLRTREIGVRVAMGAQKKNVMQLVVGQGLRIAAIGITIGLVVAFSLSKFLASQLYGVSSRDPWIFAGITLVLAATSVLACWIPARRATKVDPLVALRYE
jgi:putative ABC transport system permease protein